MTSAAGLGWVTALSLAAGSILIGCGNAGGGDAGGGSPSVASSSSSTGGGGGGATPAGSSSSAGGGTTASGAGGMGSSTASGSDGGIACVDSAGCPPPATACITSACSGGTCVLGFLPQGAPVSAQTPGDCRTAICDGMGGITSVADDTDAPVDAIPCTEEVCMNGTPTLFSLAAGTVCAPGGGVCDVDGNCVFCYVDSDCGVDTACVSHTCDFATFTCAVTNAPSGQEVPGGQTAGDCQKLVCNGNGDVTSVDDDTDVPAPDSCGVAGCTMGQPTHGPVLTDGAACDDGDPCTTGDQCTCLLYTSDAADE